MPPPKLPNILIDAPDGTVVEFLHGTSEEAMAAAMSKAYPPPTKSDEQIKKEYADQSMLGRLGTTAGDDIRALTSGISFGALDRWLGPEQEEATRQAKVRLGAASLPIEIGGALASPVTRGVGAAAKAIAPTAEGIMGALGRFGTTVGEGSTLGALDAAGHGEDITRGAVGSGLINALTHGAVNTTRLAAALSSGKSPSAYSDAFNAGKEGGAVGQSFLAGQRGQPLTAASAKYNAEEAKILPGFISPRALTSVMQTLNGQTKGGGITRLSRAGERKVSNINKLVAEASKGTSAKKLDATRQRLQEYAGSTDSQVSRVAVGAQKAIKSIVSKTNPNYSKMLDDYKKAKVAQKAGQDLSKALPTIGSLFDVWKLALGSPYAGGRAAYGAGQLRKYVPSAGKAGLISATVGR